MNIFANLHAQGFVYISDNVTTTQGHSFTIIFQSTTVLGSMCTNIRYSKRQQPTTEGNMNLNDA